jgi:predicted ArsR family transcriptional regulator
VLVVAASLRSPGYDRLRPSEQNSLSGNLNQVTTRRKLLLLLRKEPGLTVTQLAQRLELTGMGVRRHLDSLAADGLVESSERVHNGLGRPALTWRLTAAGLELFPRRYDALALDLLEDVGDHAGPEAVDAVFSRRTDKLVAEYDDALAGIDTFEERVAGVTKIRDEAGYLACCSPGDNGDLVLTENNCAVHRVAERYPAVCAMELALLRRVMGPDVEVTRVSHTMAGDPVCSYRMRPRKH